MLGEGKEGADEAVNSLLGMSPLCVPQDHVSVTGVDKDDAATRSDS